MISTTFFATIQAKGLPPKVLPCVPGWKDSAMCFFANVAPIGIPTPSPYARVEISGVTPYPI